MSERVRESAPVDDGLAVVVTAFFAVVGATLRTHFLALLRMKPFLHGFGFTALANASVPPSPNNSPIIIATPMPRRYVVLSNSLMSLPPACARAPLWRPRRQ